jgi:poly(A) polymerase
MIEKFNQNVFGVLKTLQQSGFPSWFVGGCVRDALLNISFTDYDIATIATPAEMLNVLQNFELDKTFKKYGCIKVKIDNIWVELTTLRKDIQTFGRSAVVEFTNDLSLDAQRRDFTINAIYWDGTNEWHDFFNGKQDLSNNCVKFIGNANQRVTEDYLRILRFLRFSAHYAKQINTDGLAACIEHQEQLRYLSGTRIWQEWQKLLKGKNAYVVLSCIEESGIARTLFSTNLRLDLFEKFQGKNLVLLTRLLLADLDLAYLQHRLELPKDVLDYLNLADALKESENFKAVYYQYPNSAKELVYFWAAKFNKNAHEIITQDFWKIRSPTFTLTGKHLLAIGCQPGPNVGKCLEATRNWWIENDFTPTHEECLDYVRTLFIAKS